MFSIWQTNPSSQFIGCEKRRPALPISRHSHHLLDSSSWQHKQSSAKKNYDNRFPETKSWNTVGLSLIDKLMKCVIDETWPGWSKDFSSNISGSKEGTQKQSTSN
jgi:hypothetical protein